MLTDTDQPWPGKYFFSKKSQRRGKKRCLHSRSRGYIKRSLGIFLPESATCIRIIRIVPRMGSWEICQLLSPVRFHTVDSCWSAQEGRTCICEKSRTNSTPLPPKGLSGKHHKIESLSVPWICCVSTLDSALYSVLHSIPDSTSSPLPLRSRLIACNPLPWASRAGVSFQI